MKKALLISVLLIFAVASMFAQAICDSGYWNHTYANARLKVYQQGCQTITGVIKNRINPEGTFGTGDGDWHIYVLPDSQYTWMVG